MASAVKAPSADSRIYHALRGKCMYSLASSDTSVRGQRRLQVSQEVDAALREGSITVEQSRALYDILNGVAGQDSGFSEEYVRLCEVYREYTATGTVMTEEQRESFVEEVELAHTSGVLSDQEKAALFDLTSATSSVVQPMPAVPRRSVNDVPCRRRAAQKAAQHSDGYTRLVAEYKGLYIPSDGDMHDRIANFYEKVEREYAAGNITMAEYRDCKNALDCSESVLSDVQPDVGAADFDSFKSMVLNAVANDEAISNIIKQVGAYARKNGVSDRIIKANPTQVAMEYFGDFLRSGERLATAGMSHTEMASLLKMKLG